VLAADFRTTAGRLGLTEAAQEPVSVRHEPLAGRRSASRRNELRYAGVLSPTEGGARAPRESEFSGRHQQTGFRTASA